MLSQSSLKIKYKKEKKSTRSSKNCNKIFISIIYRKKRCSGKILWFIRKLQHCEAKKTTQIHLKWIKKLENIKF